MTALLLAGIPATRAAAASVQALGWLAGCWQIDAGEPGSGEQWMAPAGGLMLGTGRTVSQGRAAAFEFMQIRAEGDTRIFVAQPQGGAATRFAEVAGAGSGDTARRISFANPRHDFPQHIAYRRDDDRLTATISGAGDEGDTVIRFHMHKVNCESFSP